LLPRPSCPPTNTSNATLEIVYYCIHRAAIQRRANEYSQGSHKTKRSVEIRRINRLLLLEEVWTRASRQHLVCDVSWDLCGRRMEVKREEHFSVRVARRRNPWGS